jgi:uncharacterized protein
MCDLVEDLKIISKPPSGDETIVLIGFPGSGLVGSIALQFLVDQMEFEHIGNVTSKYFPPLAMMARGVINVPVRFYEKDSYLAIVADIPIHPAICYEVANGILDWLNQYAIREVVAVAGIITNEPEKRVFGVASNEQSLKMIEDKTIILPMGSISGIAGSILTECKVRNIQAVGLLSETVNTPDPRGAAAAIMVLNTMYHLDIDVEPLIEQATEIEAAMAKMAEQVQSQSEGLPKKENLPMYG